MPGETLSGTSRADAPNMAMNREKAATTTNSCDTNDSLESEPTTAETPSVWDMIAQASVMLPAK